MTSSLHYLCGGLPLQPFPVNKGRNPDLPHAPKRSHRLSDQQQKQAIINALRYFPVDLHDKLRPEFEQELKDYGHIYMYR